MNKYSYLILSIPFIGLFYFLYTASIESERLNKEKKAHIYISINMFLMLLMVISLKTWIKN